MKYYVILTRKDNGKKMSLKYYGYTTARQAIQEAERVNSIKDSVVTATVEKK